MVSSPGRLARPPSPAPPYPPAVASPAAVRFADPAFEPTLGIASSRPPASPPAPRRPGAGMPADGAWAPSGMLIRWAHGESVIILATSLSLHSVKDFDCQKSAAHRQTVRRRKRTGNFFIRWRPARNITTYTERL